MASSNGYMIRASGMSTSMSSSDKSTKILLGVPGPIDQVSNATTGHEMKIVVKSGSSNFWAILTVPEDVKMDSILIGKRGREIFIQGPASKIADKSVSHFSSFSATSYGADSMSQMPPMPDFERMFARDFWAW